MSFFRRLRARTKRDPSPQAEQALRRKLDAEFAKNARKSGVSGESAMGGFFGRFPILRYAPLTAVALGLVVVSARFLSQPEPLLAPVVRMEEDAEFYEGLEDWMLTASDEDWDMLLASEGAGE